jgi:outer membrane protein
MFSEESELLMDLKSTFLAAFFAVILAAPGAAQTTRVAYVDIDRVTEKSEKINSAMGNVKGRVEEIQKDIETKRQRIVELRADIKKGDGVLAEAELKKKRDESSKLEKELVDLEYEGKREMQKLDSTLFEPMVKTIVLAIQDVAKEKNIDLVVRGEAVIYGADSADITDDVVKKLNSAAYNPDRPRKSSDSDDKESSSSSSESNSTSTKETSAKSTKEESSSSEGASAEKSGNESDSTKRSIFPSVPLVTRPVDRQSD